jgi:hypothetical protein
MHGRGSKGPASAGEKRTVGSACEERANAAVGSKGAESSAFDSRASELGIRKA